ncbi:MAG: SDR family oxidoreductase [Trueperaceae bacterium]
MDLNGKTALVTGASKGIGRAVAEALAGVGMNVALTARDPAPLEALVTRLGSAGGGRALALACDVRDLEAQREAVRRTIDAFGGLDLLVANAGVGGRWSIEDLDPDTWQRILDTNLTGVFHSVKASLDALIASRGMIVTIGSLAGTNFFAGGAAYNASKFGLLGFSQAIMLDLRDRGVRVATIMPGSVATGFGGREVSDADAWKIQPEDIAETVLYLARMNPRTLPSRIEVRPARTSLD